HEYKETIETGLKAAARGGFTTVCSMPNTNPVNDNSQVTSFIKNQGEKAGYARVLPVGAISQGLKGIALAEFGDMKKAGICAVTDDGQPVENPNLMRKALEYAKGLNLPVLSHAEDLRLADNGFMNEGRVATQLGIKGIPNASESVAVKRDIDLARVTGAKLHICHVSTKESVDAIRQAKEDGVNITCETAPHYFLLTDEAVRGYNTFAKMNPPLRSEQDRQAIVNGIADGTIDVIATDHAPHSEVEKDLEFDKAAFGIIGLETSLSLSLKLVHDKIITIEELIEKMCKMPASILGIKANIEKGSPADITIIDPEKEFEINPLTFFSKSKNTPFKGYKVKGDTYLTMVQGNIVYEK
ncbi:MAG: dihydroorotase, partial [Desulfobacterales bacterium]|nr:dihydroorotase [Desulfobacterales bacterium]